MSGLNLTLEPERQVHRFEVINGAGGRRLWTLDDKARIVAETLVPGAIVSEVARRHGLRPQQVFTWRRQARKRVASMEDAVPSFVPAVIDPAVTEATAVEHPSRPKRRPTRPPAPIELEIDGAVLRIGDGADTETVAAVIRALKGCS